MAMNMPSEPRYWMQESSGVLHPVIEAYLNGDELDAAQVATMRAYLRQWVMSPVWDANPFAEGGELDVLRALVDTMRTRKDVDNWLQQAMEMGIDPL